MKKDGGPAFPRQNDTHPNGDIIWGDTGMSLRQWYAGKALTGLLSDISKNVPVLDQANPLPEQLKWSAYKAQAAFRLADAMIAEGEKE